MKSIGLAALGCCCLLALPLPSHAASTTPSFQLSDLQKIVRLSEPQISPDGKRIAVVVSTPDFKTDKSKDEIDLVDVTSGKRRTLTWHREDLGSPRWSPDGSQLAFLAKDEKTKEDQLYVMPMDGGDAHCITEAKHGVDSFSWSPDGTQLAFVSTDEPANAKAIKAHDDAFQVTDNHFLARAALTSSHLWLIPSSGGTAKRLTEGSFSLSTDQQDGAPEPAWSRDGHSIAFTRFPGPYWGPSFHSVIDSVDVAGGAPHPLVTAQSVMDPRYAPTGKALAWLRPRGGDQNNGNAVYVSVDGHQRDVTEALARNIGNYAWLPNGKLLLAGGDGTHAVLWLQPLSGKASKLDLGEVEAGADVSIAKTGVLAFIGSTAKHPGELYVMNATSGKPRQLTQLNAFIDTLALGRTESIDWDGPDGFHEDGVLTYPVGYQSGQKYPLVLAIHGGPEAGSTVQFSPLPQLLAAAGFVVFQPNYRGSTNLGDAYQHAIYRDTGEGPGKDVMAGVAAVEKLGMVDSNRIGVSGWSYGGYMTTWLSGHYPSRWKAAVAGASLTDWLMDYTVSYYQTGDAYFFGGSPWAGKDREIWREQSPIASADKVTAPTLIMGDVGDPNVPLVNSYEWYHALRDNGVPVEFYAYPVDTHFPKDIVRTTDVYRRWVGWMTAHLN
ncbi:S9 family peptidase [Rhodanobacter sp. AS-Z3]|uniref:S9 family peptidase n=1 Tax=Rhodanobacter sp. AS-Z3 TaxID=3031330 RepID=UPI002478F7DA|nr:S9 family peptidase [Rhodanobacter sp. AS-Z3]WEN14158.1 S9 family peptidase [Rhodanobacter sp. AS-Z3]